MFLVACLYFGVKIVIIVAQIAFRAYEKIKSALKVIALVGCVEGYSQPLSGMTSADYLEITHLDVYHGMCHNGLCSTGIDRHLKPNAGRFAAPPLRFAF